MVKFSEEIIKEYLESGDQATNNTEKGRALEDLVCYLFGQVPGISITKRNALNKYKSEEIDIAFWNNKLKDGLDFLDNIILVECKNWSKPVGSEEVSWFDSKLRRRSQRFGVLVAANGITGDSVSIDAAHEIIRCALAEDRRLIVITRSEIENLQDTEALVILIQEKLCELVVSGTLFLS
jgi:hypothetical protein